MNLKVFSPAANMVGAVAEQEVLKHAKLPVLPPASLGDAGFLVPNVLRLQ